MEQREITEVEKVLRRTVEKLSRRVATLTLDLDLAYAQMELMKESEQKEEDKNAE